MPLVHSQLQRLMSLLRLPMKNPETAEETGPPPYPGTWTTADGSTVVVWVETHIAQGASAYPITPATNMGTGFEAAVANGQKNIWGEALFFLEPESEHSSASVCEGFALAGGRVTNFTSGQGLVLMKEVLYTIAGKRLPVVFHVGERALSSQSLNVHAGHDDVMAVADTGWGMLFARNVQEVQDLALIARRAAESARTPFFVVQDGFLTTHTLERVRLAEPELMRQYVGAPAERLASYFDPARPLQTGVVQNQDAYMKGRIAQRAFTERVPEALAEAFASFHRLTGRRYDFVRTYRLEDAEYVLVGFGTAMETAEAACDWMRAARGWKVGVLHVTCFRPFPAQALVATLAGCRAIAVLERTDQPLAENNPLTSELKAAFADAAAGREGYPRLAAAIPPIYSGVYGLGSRDLRAADLVAAVENMRSGGRRFFSLGIVHPSALARPAPEPDIHPPRGAYRLRGHSIGGYGSVTTNKVLASLLEEIFGLYVQAYPKYGSDKKGLPTTYYLTAAAEPIREHAELEQVDFVAVHDVQAFAHSDPLAGLVPGGVLFLQSPHADPEAVWQQIPRPARARLACAGAQRRVFYLDAAAIGRELALSPDLSLRMQGVVLLGVFLRVAPFVQAAGLGEERLFAAVEKALAQFFGRRGPRIVAANLEAVRRGWHELRELPLAELATAAAARTGPPSP